MLTTLSKATLAGIVGLHSIVVVLGVVAAMSLLLFVALVLKSSDCVWEGSLEKTVAKHHSDTIGKRGNCHCKQVSLLPLF